MPRPSLNLLLFIVAVSAARFFLWYFFDWTVENSELFAVVGVAATASVGYSLISGTARNWFKSKASRAFASKATTKYLSGAIVVLTMAPLLLGRIDLVYTFNQDISVDMNGRSKTITGDGQKNRKKTFGLPMSALSLKIGRYSAVQTYYPFTKSEISIPFNVSIELDADLQRIEGQLVYAFFQFYEPRYLSNAKVVIAAQASDPGKQKALARLSLIAQILELSIVGGDISGARNDLFNRFRVEYANDAWNGMLEAAVAYSNGEYYKASEVITNDTGYEFRWPGKLAKSFFKAVCLLKSSRSAAEPERSSRLEQALDGFKSTEILALQEPEEIYKGHALASSVIFQGIHHFYKQEMQGAKAEFIRAAELASGSLRARALNGAGYLEFVEGDLQKAELHLLDALESDPDFAYALSNYGYVLMAKDQYDIALSYFERNANSAELRANSPRDVLLAELAIGHAREELTDTAEGHADYYSSVLKSSGYRDFFAVTPTQLRLAYQYAEMAEKIYLSKDYYGLEVFALALLSRARATLETLPESDARVRELTKRILAIMDAIKPNVPLAWLSDENHRGAFFSRIRRY